MWFNAQSSEKFGAKKSLAVQSKALKKHKYCFSSCINIKQQIFVLALSCKNILNMTIILEICVERKYILYKYIPMQNET